MAMGIYDMILYLAFISAIYNGDWLTAWLILVAFVLHMLKPVGLTKS